MDDEHATHPRTDTAGAIAFLKALRPKGPWALTAIIPDGVTTTKSFEASDEAGAAAFIKEHNQAGKNLYYTLNLCGRPISKPSKADMTGAIALHADSDPDKDETIEAAKTRIMAVYEAHRPPPSIIVNSGNGLQAIWLLDRGFEIPQAPPGPNNPARKARIEKNVAPIEDRNRALASRVGAPAGTHNVDRLLRLPGTVNWPNAAKALKGRIACLSSVIRSSDVRYPLDDFPTADGGAGKSKSQSKGPGKGKSKGKPGGGGAHQGSHGADEHGDDADNETIAEAIKTGSAGAYGGDRSRALFAVICHLIKWGHCRKKIARIVLKIPGDIAEHIAAQAGDPEMTIERQIARAVQKIDFYADPKKGIVNSIQNIRIAFAKMGVTLRYDQFALQDEIEGLKGFGPLLDDAALNRLRVTLHQRFSLRPPVDLFMLVANDTAQTNRHHPVKDYLAGLHWDGAPRVDTWLIDHGGAADTPYVRAVSALPLIAAVRRIRQPGCKFDEMLVLEGKQGSSRSTAIRTLAVRDEWFSDSVPFNADPQKVIERLSGKWILEAAELSGIKKADVEHYKQFLSSPGESARPAYGRKKLEAPRQCVFIGTTNEEHYLRDETGNRRNWGVKLTGAFDIEALKRDRDQLWAEASFREAAGESIRLDESLWPAAAAEQIERMVADPFDDILNQALRHLEGKISSLSVLTILNIPEGQRTPALDMRAANAMKRLGWMRPNNAIWLDGKTRRAYLRGEAPHELITAERQHYSRQLEVKGGRDIV
jgi:predicted P-loop ATPase